jgi:xanthine dehydrogenase small subunit
MRDSVSFFINGVKKEVKGDLVFQTLSDFLRYEQRLTGTKVVCAEGDCGACSVMLAKWNPQAQSTHYEAVNSCIAMTFAMDGANLVTVEGLAPEGELSEVQCSMVRNFGGQCGFCTPGFVMAITNMYEQKNTAVTEQNAKNYLTGNLCRCTGYSPILQAALDVDVKKHKTVRDLYKPVDLSEQMQTGVHIITDKAEYFAPTTLKEACQFKNKHPNVVLFSGATDLGVRLNKGHLQTEKILSLHLIPELYKKEIVNDEVHIGSRVTLYELEKRVAGKIESLEKFLHLFASPQIKNSATLVGNLANASPIADTTPLMLALDAELEIVGLKGLRKIALKDFYLDYKKIDLKADEIITRVLFKVPASTHKIFNYKISQRRDLDISTVNASFNFSFDGKKITSARLAYGGVAATTIRLEKIEKYLVGKELDNQTVSEIKKEIISSIKPLSDLRGSGEYRKILAGNLFEKFAAEVQV